MGIYSFKFLPSGLYHLYYHLDYIIFTTRTTTPVCGPESDFTQRTISSLSFFKVYFLSSLTPHKAKSEQRVTNNEDLHVTLVTTLGFKGHT